MTREFRSIKTRELRAETEDGKRYLSGYAANYNVMSEDLGWGMRERIMPGAFTRAVSEKQDVRHLKNHDPNLVLGRTKSGTTVLSDDAKGLRFRTLLPDTSYANDLFTSVDRGDIDECSFGFMAVRTAWVEEPDPDDATGKSLRVVRELHDVDLFDVSTVTYPAYPGTNTDAARSKFMWPDGVPAEIRSRQERRADPEPCACQCAECLDGDCADCSNADCVDENCRCEMSARALRAKKDAKTKRVDGEDLLADCFLIADPLLDTRNWKLPVKFSTPEKTAAHLRNNLVRFNDLKVVDEARAAAWPRLVALCKAAAIDGALDANLRARLTPDQIYDFEKDQLRTMADARVRAIQASL